MQTMQLILFGVVLLSLLFFGCSSKNPMQNLIQFNTEFFAKYLPEYPQARLMTKADIPEHQLEFFDEADGKLQMLLDLNKNDVPEYIICGVSEAMLQRQEKGPYFVAIFEQSKNGINRLYLQKLIVPPVTLDAAQTKNRSGVVISFAFYSDYAAEIYYADNTYQIENW
ncbi:MAG: hypothetical protein ACOY90_11920 [Candidatus Zhuqueibacterota bacterium]